MALMALFRIRFVNSLQYRAAAAAGIVTQFAWGFMYILAYRAFYESNPAAFPMTLQQTVAYVWILQAFLVLLATWRFEPEIFESIENGHVSYELVRPMDLYFKWFTTSAASRVAGVVLRCVPILVVAFILPPPFRLVLPYEIWRLLLFLVSVFLSMAVVISCWMLIYVSAFYTISSKGIRVMFLIAGDFLGGGIIPIVFFPDTLRFLVELSPFGAMYNLPLMIFNGVLVGDAIVRGMVLQVVWFIVLVIIGRALMKRTLNKVIIQGG